MRYSQHDVIYDGEPYGDLLVLADAVRRCMQSPDTSLPRVILIDSIFECYTTLGWKQVYGCTAEGEIFLDAPVLVQTEGVTWSHELTHYYGTAAEDNPCGGFRLEGFSIARADGGADEPPTASGAAGSPGLPRD